MTVTVAHQPRKKCAVCWKSVEKWIKENDQSFNTTIRLKFDSYHVFRALFCVKFASCINMNCLVYITTILRFWRGQVL